MREEFDLHATSLTKVEYPDVFPSPPGSTPYPENSAPADRAAWESVHQQSWYYYLSDIAYRRINNRVINTLYDMSKEEWLSVGVRRLHRIAEELDKQTMQWWENIPGSPSPTLQEDTDELTFMLYLDYADLRERIWRPFLYIAIHGVLSDADKVLVTTSAMKCLNLSFDLLEGARLKHRHHGCWLTIRCMFTKVLLILAAAKSGRVEIRNDWQSRVRLFQDYLRYWEIEAPDLAAMRSALSELL
jgi:hypothetical protein